jgi:hypothetical protein
LHFLPRELAGAADGFRLLSRFPFGRFLIMAAELHFAENTLTLHLLLQYLERLVDIVVTYKDLHIQSFLRSRRKEDSPAVGSVGILAVGRLQE